MSRLGEARAYVASGVSLVPIGAGTKTPARPWKDFQERLPKDEELSEWIDRHPGLGVVCGAVSGNLEVLDIESIAPLNEFADLVKKRAPGLLNRLPRVMTPSGGRHLFFRCAVIEGNQKLATDKTGKTLIETRGQGGQVLSPLCLAETHPSGKVYELLSGDLTKIPTITVEEREILFSAARSFNEHIQQRKAKGVREAAQGNGTKPGEDFNNRPDVLGQVQSLLREHEWSKFGDGRAGELWSRPGVEDHSSATLYDSGYLYVFSSNANPFNSNEAYSPFAIYTELKHSGDFSAAARDLAVLGLGQSNGHNPSAAPSSKKIIPGSSQSKQQDTSLDIVKMADVEPEEVVWLWSPYIAVSKLTLLEGDPGIGKSWITAALACAVSRGRGLPGIGNFEAGNVLMLSAEDGLADTLRPRLDAVGADVTRVFALNQPLTFDEKGLLSLEEVLIEYTPIRLLTVDPLFAFTGGKVDIHRANECRTITARLALIAEKHECSIVAVRHLGKSRGMGHALNAGIGSIDLVAAARSVLLAGKDPDDDNKRAVVQIKSNLGPPGPAVGFTLRGGEFFWTGESDLTDARILSYAAGESERPALDEACEFLRDELSAGESDVATLKTNARRAGISEVTLRRAKERLGAKAKKLGGYFGNKPAHWAWCLSVPEDDQAPAEGDRKTGDDHLQSNHSDKSTCSNRLAEDDHDHNSDHLQERYEPVFTDPERRAVWDSWKRNA